MGSCIQLDRGRDSPCALCKPGDRPEGVHLGPGILGISNLGRDHDGDPASNSLEGIRDTLSRIQRQLELAFTPPSPAPPAAAPVSVARSAAAEVRRRNAQLQAFGHKLVGNPAWDMLIDLFLAQEAGKSISVSSLCIASNAPQTTALRWIDVLEKIGLIARASDPHDKRRANLTLTPAGSNRVVSCLAQMQSGDALR